MTKEFLASLLTGREYGSEITDGEEAQAKSAGLVVIFGYSDDNVELRGVIHDEQGCYGGGTLKIHKTGILTRHSDCECDFCGFPAAAKKCATVKLLWSVGGYAWKYETDLSHATFEIVEGGEKYCSGIVISINDLPVVKN